MKPRRTPLVQPVSPSVSARDASPQRSLIGRLRPVFDRLAEIAQLNEDWDTYGGAPPTAIAVGAVGQLIIAVAENLVNGAAEEAVPYSVMPIPNGGVQVAWHRASDELQIDIGPGGEFGYLRIEYEGGERRASEADGITFTDTIEAIEHFLR
jgi:hypothetical protein